MPTNTYVALATQTVVGSSTSSVTFSSIPQGYTDLVIVVNGSNNTGDSEIAIRTGNGSVNTGSVYSTTFLFGNGSSAGSSRTSNRTWADAARTDTTRSTSIIHIMNYSNTTTNKTILARGSNSTLAIATVSLVRDTAAINTIQLAAHYDATFNFTDGTTFTIYGIAAVPQLTAKATGGTIYYGADGYVYHKFTSSGTFAPTQALTADILVVAGGGGGGSQVGGGGGAGGLLEFSSQALSVTNYSCAIGAGGAAGTYTNTGPITNRGTSGADSQFGALTACVGGGAGGAYNGWAGLNGGSGGGADGNIPSGTGAGTTGQGFAGGTGFNTQWAGGGGGGAGGLGGNASAYVGGNGGIGKTSALINSMGAITSSGQNSSGTYYFAGGGGGCSQTNAQGAYGTGGLGGGARGTNNDSSTPPAGTVNTGGGGGGSRDQVSPGFSLPSAGGSGIVIVRYLG